MIKEVVKYHIDNYGASIDTVWWGCRYSDMKVYSEMYNPGHKRKGCMYPDEYPFDVWKFVESFSKDEFMEEVLRQLMEHNRMHDEKYLNYIRSCFAPRVKEEKPAKKARSLQLELSFL